MKITIAYSTTAGEVSAVAVIEMSPVAAIAVRGEAFTTTAYPDARKAALAALFAKLHAMAARGEIS